MYTEVRKINKLQEYYFNVFTPGALPYIYLPALGVTRTFALFTTELSQKVHKSAKLIFGYNACDSYP